MKKTLPLFTKTAIYMTEVVGMCNFYTFFASREEYNYACIEMLPWLLLSLATFFVVHIFLKKERPLSQVVTLSIISFLITVVIMSVFFIHVTGIIAWIITWVFLGISTIRATMLNLEDSDLKSVLVRCELPALGIALLFCLNTSTIYYFPAYYMPLTLVVLLLNLLALTITRMHTLGASDESKSSSAIATAIICLLTIGGVSITIAYFTASIAAITVEKTTTAISWLSSTLYSIVTGFFTWLFSLFPETEYHNGEMEPVTYATTELGDMAEISTNAFTITLVCIAIAVVILILGLLFKFRNLKLGKKRIQRTYQRPQQVTEKIALLTRIKAFIITQLQRIYFEFTVISKRNTPEGAVILLSRIGKKHGVVKQKGESYHNYLHRLRPFCRETQLLEELSSIIDQNLYGKDEKNKNLTIKGHKTLRKIIIYNLNKSKYSN